MTVANSQYREIVIAHLAERDGPVCALCGEKLEFNVPSHTSRFVSVDHIVSRSKGGLNVFSNVQLAHWGCNSRKSSLGRLKSIEERQKISAWQKGRKKLSVEHRRKIGVGLLGHRNNPAGRRGKQQHEFWAGMP